MPSVKTLPEDVQARYETRLALPKGTLITCTTCGASMYKARPDHVFCGTRCRITFHNAKRGTK